MATQLKNKTARGAKMMKMDDKVYALRRSVMGIIYEAKRMVDLPRVEVRIVEIPPCTLGYAYVGKNIIHISNSVVEQAGMDLKITVLHEILHAVKSVRHDRSCPLMAPTIQRGHDEAVYWDAFKRHF